MLKENEFKQKIINKCINYLKFKKRKNDFKKYLKFKLKHLSLQYPKFSNFNTILANRTRQKRRFIVVRRLFQSSVVLS